MVTDPRPVFKRRAFANDDGKGHSTAEWTLTPSSLTDPVQIIAEPVDSLPIVFVPGIMGSNLMARVDVDGRKKGQPLWLMDDKVGALSLWYRTTPAQRQQWLNPATTAVYALGAVPSHVPSIGNAEAIRTRRFWGEVGAMSYGEFLEWLQGTMNHAGRVSKWRAGLGRPDFAARLTKGMNFEPLTEDNIAHAAYFRFPVYACGYNWLQSNLEAAGMLAQRIDHVIAANNVASYRCHKVILVTHSMGGLVARACSELAGMREKIAGIVHGVMPATGAAVAYKRVRAGTEGAAGFVIGNNAEKVTAVFANAPGALQLLPTRDYGGGWLRLGQSWRGGSRDFVRLPQADPYEEIYKQRGPWWALVREELINPGAVDGHRGWSDYIKNIDMAAHFHAQLAGRYHPNTYSFHGDGKAQGSGLTWGNVSWFSGADFDRCGTDAADLLAAQPVSDDGEGRAAAAVGRYRHEFVLASTDTTGDGTVPARSGRAPAAAGAKATYELDLSGEGHEGAYRDDTARSITLQSILQIAQTVHLSL